MVLKEVYRKCDKNNETVDSDLSSQGTWNIQPGREDQEAHAPFNILWIFNDSDEKLEVRFDGQTDDYFHVFPKTTAGVTLDDGISFNWISITNLSATDPADDEVAIRITRIKDVPGEV